MSETAPSRLLLRLARLIGALLIIAARPALAVAEEPAEHQARAHFYAAEQHFSAGHFRQALAGYRRAYALRPLPGLLFNIAQCYRNLGHCGQAVRYYRRFIAEVPRSPFADDVRAIIARCSRQQPAAASPPPVAGHSANRRQPASRHRLLWSGVVLTGALAAAATITGALAFDRNQRYKDPATDPTERPALRHSGENLALATNLLWGTAAASAVATMLVYWLDGKRERPVTSAALSLNADRLVLGVGGRF